MAIGPGMKDDGGKLPWGLLMGGLGLALRAVVEVLQFGAKKYAANSWQNVEGGYERYKDALYRHLHALEQGGIRARDPETGLLELAHIGCNALFLCWFAIQADAKHDAEKQADVPVEQLRAKTLERLKRVGALKPGMDQIYAQAIQAERARQLDANEDTPIKFPSHGINGLES